MESVLIVIHLVIVVARAGGVGLQRSEGGGLGMGSSPSGFMTGRGQANLLTRATAILGAAFFAMSLLLSILAARGGKPASVIDQIAPAAPSAPGAPNLPASAPNLLEQLRGMQNGGAPAAPAPTTPAPAVPAAPPANP